jgi:hypothetical protein
VLKRKKFPPTAQSIVALKILSAILCKFLFDNSQRSISFPQRIISIVSPPASILHS